ncbi:MAG: tetratricopeptide repeat protein [Prochlorococcus sp.]|jgi:Flp pilus assembly protein TadD|nr:tetratricopeptide repeat protein [Prochlorococcaceae cyanobacterium ETNP18_MAG_1]
MNTVLPQTYLIGLIGLLVIVAFVVGRQLLKVRGDEQALIRLEKAGAPSSKEASELYELASVQLRKRLYPQAIATLRKALKRLEGEPDEAKALIENALGFALAAQKDFKSAVSHYQAALKAKADYPVALNNLAFAQEQLEQNDQASKVYQQVLELDPQNSTAQKRLKRLKKTNQENSPEPANGKGF